MPLSELQLADFKADLQVMLSDLADQGSEWYSILQSIRAVVPGFAPGITQEFGLTGDQCAAYLAEAEAEGNAVIRNVPRPSQTRPVKTTTASDEPTPDTTGEEISPGSVLTTQVMSHSDAKFLLDQIGPRVGDWDGKRLAAALLVLTQNISVLDTSLKLGAFNVLTDYQLAQWKSQNSKEKRIVGPYLLMKFLVQCNVFFQVYDEPTTGTRWIEWERNGVKVLSCNRRMVQGEINDELTPSEWEQFLQGLEVDRKALVFEDIPLDHYKIIDLFTVLFRVTRDNTSHKLVTYPSKTAINLSPNAYEYMTELKEILERDPCHIGDADAIVEFMALRVKKVSTHKADVLKTIESNLTRTGLAAENIRTVLTGLAGKKDAEREQGMQAIGASPVIAAVIEKVSKDRADIRNVSPVTQYVEKNAGSPAAHGLPQALDTAIKGKYIMDVMTRLGAPIDNPEKTIHMYGVAYGHMQKIMNVRCKVMYYDNKPAGKSQAMMTHGSIWNANGQYIMDDSRPTTIDDPALNIKLSKHYTISHAKMARFVEHCSGVIVSKISMDHLASKEQIQLFTNIIYDSKFTYAQIVKFGKLHNPEAFIILSDAHKRPPSLAGDIKCVALCMSVANSIITSAHLKGVRLDASDKIHLGSVWESLVKALPIRWNWYLTKYKKGQLVGGAHYDKVVVEGDSGDYNAGMELLYEGDSGIKSDDAPVAPTKQRKAKK